jgi:hypothetical protein
MSLINETTYAFRWIPQSSLFGDRSNPTAKASKKILIEEHKHAFLLGYMIRIEQAQMCG